MTKTVISSALATLVICFLTGSEVRGTDYSQKLDEYLTKELKSERFTGSVLVARANQVVFIKGYGHANRELNVPNAPNTKFRLASITKQFTAMCILTLQEQGKLSVDDLISKFIPDCPNQWSKITIRHLLTHTSGIPTINSFLDYDPEKPSSPEKTIQRFRDKPLDFKPGERYSYSNAGYILLGSIVEKASGKSYEQYVKEVIFKPLGMNDSGYDHFEKILPFRASGYTRSGDIWENAPYIDMNLGSSAGALYSTVEDFFRWYQCWRERKILSESSWKVMTTPERIGPEHDGYGFGIVVGEHQLGKTTQKVFFHYGGVNGFSTSMMWFPDADLFIAAFANSFSTDNIVQIAQNLEAIMFDMPVLLPKFAGIGTLLDTKDGKYFIKNVMDGSGAAQAGLKAGDSITHIDSKEISSLQMREVADLIRGEPNTQVTLTIIREGEAKPQKVTVTRHPVNIK